MTQLISTVVELELGSSDPRRLLNYEFASIIQQEMPSSGLIGRQAPNFVPVTTLLWNCSLAAKMRMFGLGKTGGTVEGYLDSVF